MVKTTLSRISSIVRSNVNELLDQLEDPEKMVRQMVRDMETEVDRVTGAVGTAVAGVRRLQKEQEGSKDRSAQLQARARQALEAGEEEADPSLDQIPPATAEDLPSPGQPANDLDVITFDLPDLVQAPINRSEHNLTALNPLNHSHWT